MLFCLKLVNCFGNNVFRVKSPMIRFFVAMVTYNLEHYPYFYFFIFEKANFFYLDFVSIAHIHE